MWVHKIGKRLGYEGIKVPEIDVCLFMFTVAVEQLIHYLWSRKETPTSLDVLESPSLPDLLPPRLHLPWFSKENRPQLLEKVA